MRQPIEAATSDFGWPEAWVSDKRRRRVTSHAIAIDGGTTLRASAALGVSIIAVWVIVAKASGQSLFADQNSNLILSYGAVDGAVFDTHEWWRLITSQWLHTKGAHMLFNVVGILLAGSALERAQGWKAMLGLYFAAGSIAVLASVMAYPNEVSSGASQAMLALCGAAALLPLATRKVGVVWLAILAVTVVQLGLDVKAVHAIKAGHAAGVGIGLTWGAIRLVQHSLVRGTAQ